MPHAKTQSRKDARIFVYKAEKWAEQAPPLQNANQGFITTVLTSPYVSPPVAGIQPDRLPVSGLFIIFPFAVDFHAPNRYYAELICVSLPMVGGFRKLLTGLKKPPLISKRS